MIQLMIHIKGYREAEPKEATLPAFDVTVGPVSYEEAIEWVKKERFAKVVDKWKWNRVDDEGRTRFISSCSASGGYCSLPMHCITAELIDCHNPRHSSLIRPHHNSF